MSRVELSIEGMSCDHCIRAVRTALEALSGVRPESVAIGSAVVDFDPAQTDEAAIAGAVTRAGYRARPRGDAA